MIEKKINIIFAGTPEFSVPFLNELVKQENFFISAVITAPDKPVGRGLSIKKTPIKELAEKFEIPVWQPQKIKDLEKKIKEISPDFIVVVAYGQLIPSSILDIPTHGCINVHGSLLPKYRGSSCLQAPILNGDDKTGITIMKMDKGLDTGAILSQTILSLSGQETTQDLHDQLSELGAKALPPVLIDCYQGKLKEKPQDNQEASYCVHIKKEDGRINWNQDAEQIARMIRAYSPWPTAFTKLPDGKTLKIISAQAISDNQTLANGEIFLYNGGVAVKCKNSALVLRRVQLEGKKALGVEDFLRGQTSFVGNKLV